MLDNFLSIVFSAHMIMLTESVLSVVVIGTIIYLFLNRNRMNKTRFKGAIIIACAWAFVLPIIIGIIFYYILAVVWLLGKLNDIANSTSVLFGLFIPVVFLILLILPIWGIIEYIAPLLKRIISRYECLYRTAGTAEYTPAERYLKYIEENKTKLGLFIRPAVDKYHIIFANKYCVINFDLLASQSDDFKINILDKQTGVETVIEKMNGYNRIYNIFDKILQKFSYDITADDLEKIIFDNGRKSKKSCTITQISHEEVCIDINNASEAELTAIPGITIAKAKHAVKVRNKQLKFLTANQFFKAIGLNEEFVEQITVNGNKVILNNLPEYQKIGVRRDV